MNQRRRRRMTIRPSKAMITISRIGGGIFAVMGAAFAVIGFTTLIPSGAGLFGIVWTLIACSFVGIGIYGAGNKKGMYFMYEWSIDEEVDGDEPPSSPAASAEERLRQLQSLRQQGMISDAEYEEKRKEILKEL